jgi:hypothetical protein
LDDGALMRLDLLAEDVEIVRQHVDHVFGGVLLADRGEVVDVGEQRRHILAPRGTAAEMTGSDALADQLARHIEREGEDRVAGPVHGAA